MFSFFFFFKQKTAYEMRISDWSSDVCSSDLDLLVKAADQLVHGLDALLLLGEVGFLLGFQALALDRVAPEYLDGGGHCGDLVLAPVRRNLHGDVALGQEIGRASCRERVCQ